MFNRNRNTEESFKSLYFNFIISIIIYLITTILLQNENTKTNLMNIYDIK